MLQKIANYYDYFIIIIIIIIINIIVLSHVKIGIHSMALEAFSQGLKCEIKCGLEVDGTMGFKCVKVLDM